MTDDIRRSRTAFFWVGVIIPVAILLITAAVIATWLPELPDPIATHWGTSGVDGFAPKWAAIALPLGVGGGTVALMALIGAFGHRMPQSSTTQQVQAWGPTSRFLGGMGLGIALFISYIGLVTAGLQRGLADATQTPDIGRWIPIAFVLLLGGTALGWFLQPRSPERAAEAGAQVAGITLQCAERAAWFGTAKMARGATIGLVGTMLLMLVLSFVILAQEAGGGWILLGTTALLLVLVATMLVFRVQVSDGGLQVRSILGWPNTRIPLDRIERIEVVQIAPMAEFGGWGWRIGVDGRRGVVLRAGEALQVTDSRGKVFVVTVDGAREAAAVLESLRERAMERQRRRTDLEEES
ncbi:DUF1648 domain-containing protein [Microbacterium sp. H1-D42]|uniref:DUF1648 domain-containing protein n=1 Tax=Microbacterium sp. H1-D42 TaxID=2925844 RepID=UPI001F53A873|nr:DUF1648 domain-containing protein [Microbacterium sp. H1-D42]UNK69897.1 DUF1648 domain-containing protein [Microbacterium sp. H1-D42]